MFLILLNCESVDDGEPSTSAFMRGIGTRDDENGDAPGDGGTFGLLELFKFGPPGPWNEVVKDPVKNKLESDELPLMDRTLGFEPVSPPKGGFDHVDDPISQKATLDPGEVNWPPTQMRFSFISQYIALTAPFGPPDPKEVNPEVLVA
jgi:hypothetical protein